MELKKMISGISNRKKLHIALVSFVILVGGVVLVFILVNIGSSVSIEVANNISYGDHTKQKLDLCKPTNVQGKVPGVMLIHGEGGDKSQYEKECKELAKKGIVAIAVNYREGPLPTYRVVLADDQAALEWLTARDDIDITRIGVMGESLGGYISSLIGTHEIYGDPKCIVNNFGPTDFSNLEEWKGSSLLDEVVENLFGGITIKENPQLYISLSPLSYVSANDGESWLFTRSANDQLVPKSQVTKMMSALNKVGIQTELFEYNGKGEGHANRLPFWKALSLFRKKIDFLKNCL